jgi:hypothetical protein
MLIMATDGIRSGFEADVRTGLSATETARSLLNLHQRGCDDALVTVVQFLRRES